MNARRDDLLAIERAAVRGWPALETAQIDGWLARWSTGGSTRANSVAALAFKGQDLDRSLARVVDFYRARGGAPTFTVSDVSAPDGLDGALEQRGWARSGDHVTMAKDIDGTGTRAAAATIAIEMRDAPTPAWFAVYMQGLTESRKGVAARLVEGTPRPRAFVSGLREGRVIASGLTVIDGPLASVQCMATDADARRSGAARAVLAAIESHAAGQGARRLYLQADGDNRAAIGLYASVGFSLAGRYHTRAIGG